MIRLVLKSPAGLLAAGLLSLAMLVAAAEDVAPVVRTVDGPASALEPEQIAEVPLTASDRDHWAFRPITRSLPPKVVHTRWPQSGLDAFILARLEQFQVDPPPAADRASLLRRLAFDLTGLPPDVEDIATFEADPAPDAGERQIDRLLASTAYGERWAQHWLDLARFAETDGFEHDKVRGDAWKYRDWVIDALNRDLPYDQFVRLQIAGDMLDRGDQSVATMFCLSGPDMPDLNDQLERRHRLLNELTSTVGSVFLGLQLGCAECHDHKFDPVSQKDFYQLRAVFESAIPPLKRDAPWSRLQPQAEAVPARFWIRGDHRRPGPAVDPGFPRIASDQDSGDLPTSASSPRIALADWLVRPQNPLTARVIVNRIWKQDFGRGLFDTPSDVGLLNAEPTHPELLDWLASELQSGCWSLKWLQRQIVGSATYRQASRSTPPDRDWARRLQIDPDNRLCSRHRRQRLDGESLRDAMLSMAGLLTDERGGPGVMAPLPEELVGTLLKGQWKTSTRLADHDRRSIYLFARRNLRYPLFEVFDRPDANASCAVRTRSTTAPQSLLLLNSPFSLRIAQHLATRIQSETDAPDQQVRLLFLRAFSRPPSTAESQQLLQFLTQERDQLRSDRHASGGVAPQPGIPPAQDPATSAAFVEACLAILNASELVYID